MDICLPTWGLSVFQSRIPLGLVRNRKKLQDRITQQQRKKVIWHRSKHSYVQRIRQESEGQDYSSLWKSLTRDAEPRKIYFPTLHRYCGSGLGSRRKKYLKQWKKPHLPSLIIGNCSVKPHNIISVSWLDELCKIAGNNFSLVFIPAPLKKTLFFRAHKLWSVAFIHPEIVVTIALGN